ncbi:MAG: succinylglutamate desuccinylase/aspartoacylase family protein [Planctomycetes bacterium]|nr:succinylglutamate desuccinylase/aspartoacylase family protein [Planctomycetota bacterium]
MARTVVSPQEVDFDAPGRRDYWVALEHDSIWGAHLIPLTVIVGPQAQPGRGVAASGSNHGNEYEGPVAIRHLLREIRTEDVTGRILLIPVLNPAAFKAGKRESQEDDGVNLNRAFVDGAGKTPALAGITHRIAAFVREQLFPQVHTWIDLHAGGDVAQFALATSFHPIEDPKQAREIEETARWFGTPLVVAYQNRTPGLLPSDAERLGKIMVGGEFGYGESVNPQGVRFAKHGIVAAAIHQGQMKGSIEKFAHHADGSQRLVEMVDPACFVSAPWPGHYEPLYPCGERIKKGQTVALLHDFNRIDEAPYEVQARHDGMLTAQAWRAPVRQGQSVAVIAKVVN